MSAENLYLWHAVEKTDPAATKGFSGKGGFSGTAISPMWLIKRATEHWGPMGEKWGIRIISQELMAGAPIIGKDGECIGNETVHVVQAEVYHPGGSVPCFGQTQFVGMRKDGRFYTDEEAPKKSLTDALTKGLSWLGFAADVHMGLFDDVKYVNRVGQEFQEEKRVAQDKEAARGIREKHLPVLQGAAEQGSRALQAVWATLTPAIKRELEKDKDALKTVAANVDRKEPAHASN